MPVGIVSLKSVNLASLEFLFAALVICLNWNGVGPHTARDSLELKTVICKVGNLSTNLLTEAPVSWFFEEYLRIKFV